MGMLVSLFPEKPGKVVISEGKLIVTYEAKAGAEPQPFSIAIALPKLDDPNVYMQGTSNAETVYIGEQGYEPAIAISVFNTHSYSAVRLAEEIYDAVSTYYEGEVMNKALELAEKTLEERIEKEKDRTKRRLLMRAVQFIKNRRVER